MKKGTPKGVRYGGRQKGTTNKRNAETLEIAARLGVCPFEVLLMFAKNDWKGLGYEDRYVTKYTGDGSSYDVEVIDPSVRLAAAKEATQYLHAKRRHEDKDGQPENPQVQVSPITQQELVELVKAARGTK